MGVIIFIDHKRGWDSKWVFIFVHPLGRSLLILVAPWEGVDKTRRTRFHQKWTTDDWCLQMAQQVMQKPEFAEPRGFLKREGFKPRFLRQANGMALGHETHNTSFRFLLTFHPPPPPSPVTGGV